MEESSNVIDPNQAIEILGIQLVGLSADNGKRILITIIFVAAVVALHYGLMAFSDWIQRRCNNERIIFWLRQTIRMITTGLILICVVSVWFDNPTSLATVFGLLTAGLAFAMQRVITALVGYFIILRGKTFKVGDRISIGGVRGEVIALHFFHTTLMEMGQPPSGPGGEGEWVRSRQYTGRIVTVSNDKIFDDPVYNFSGDFPYLWEEINLPITYNADRTRAENILLSAARRHAISSTEIDDDILKEMQHRYNILKADDIAPKVYFRLTDNWLELTVRFVTKDHGIRELKDTMSREILEALDQAGIGIASATFEIVGLPPLQVRYDGNPR
ncbi:mechanosensitive ion channel domain-containing protein [Methylococcus sp. ANG]|uniref:mechanosensitive ion channel family protein n=1 Tax=Methylococcus sp. ANG TaxID=3231903 RepID=UPI00345A9449